MYDHLGTFAQINQSFRTEAHANRLFYGLRQGLISSIVTDHAPHLIEETSTGWDGAIGRPGRNIVASDAAVYHQKNATLNDVTRWLSGAPNVCLTLIAGGCYHRVILPIWSWWI